VEVSASANGLLLHPCVVYSAKGSVYENGNQNGTLTCPFDVASAAATTRNVSRARKIERKNVRRFFCRRRPNGHSGVVL